MFSPAISGISSAILQEPSSCKQDRSLDFIHVISPNISWVCVAVTRISLVSSGISVAVDGASPAKSKIFSEYYF